MKEKELAEKIVDLTGYGQLHVNDILPDIKAFAEESKKEGREEMVIHAEAHYWDSVQENRETILEHIRNFIPHIEGGIGENAARSTKEKKRCIGNCPNTCKIHMGEYQFCTNPSCECHEKKA